MSTATIPQQQRISYGLSFHRLCLYVYTLLYQRTGYRNINHRKSQRIAYKSTKTLKNICAIAIIYQLLLKIKEDIKRSKDTLVLVTILLVGTNGYHVVLVSFDTSMLAHDDCQPQISSDRHLMYPKLLQSVMYMFMVLKNVKQAKQCTSYTLRKIVHKPQSSSLALSYVLPGVHINTIGKSTLCITCYLILTSSNRINTKEYSILA